MTSDPKTAAEPIVRCGDCGAPWHGGDTECPTTRLSRAREMTETARRRLEVCPVTCSRCSCTGHCNIEALNWNVEPLADRHETSEIGLGSIVRAFPIVPAQSKWIERVGVVVEVVSAHKAPRTPHMRGGPSNHSRVRFVIQGDEGPPIIRRATQIQVVRP